ncbi:4-(cytidine 5'-diphospho)-2-C-methyl-D-erythritol kinase [Bifidobacterium imperatoris]|nr:4-(cytidine 5'-diphospho)-2-C-methyl-D-erythritol kinase [Bifidobacterium imperatoris]PLS24760.1 4-diphosphocytidyl-2C-methyl-D-erythritol kinase [Bifidobacterium imperatoris]
MTIATAPIVERLHTSQLADTVRVDCPAKTNLTLEVGPTHEEWGGRHALDTIYCAVGVYDTVTATAKAPGTGFSLELEGAHLGDLASSSSDMRRNHAVLALFAMAQEAGREPDVALTITKRIPVGAGLGGGSADAAAAILAINQLWNLNWPMERLRTIAATLGADMPFCLTGGLAHGTGFGEQIEDILDDSPLARELQAQGFTGEVLIGAYQSQLSTPEVYHTFDVVGAGSGDRNHLQAAAISLHPRSGQAIEAALQAGARHAFVSGSGPSVVAFVPDSTTAQRVIDTWVMHDAADRIIRAQAPVTPIIGVTQ